VRFWNYFWKWLAVFAWKRIKPQWAPNVGNLRLGLPGFRDPGSPCEHFAPKPVQLRNAHRFECWSDGHYLCKECTHYVPEPVQETDEEQEAALDRLATAASGEGSAKS
jgi:hypothetical protein